MTRNTHHTPGKMVVAVSVSHPRMLLTLGLAAAAAWAMFAYPVLERAVADWQIPSFWSSEAPAVERASAARTASPAVGQADGAARDTILDLIRIYRLGMSEEAMEQLADAIHRESVAASIDPLMVASIVARESSFRSRAVSHAGAVGLMQLRPFVAEEVARQSAMEWNGVATLHSPQRNVRLGILYYKELLDRFDGDAEVALTAYNYGPTRVSHQILNGTYRGSAYAADVLGMYESLSEKRS